MLSLFPAVLMVGGMLGGSIPAPVEPRTDPVANVDVEGVSATRIAREVELTPPPGRPGELLTPVPFPQPDPAAQAPDRERPGTRAQRKHPIPIAPAAETVGQIEPPRRWYGWQLLMVDVSAVCTATVAPTAGLVVGALGAPTLHLLNGNVRSAAISFAIRGSLTLAVAQLRADRNTSPQVADLFGDALVALAAVQAAIIFFVVDDFFLSKTTKTPVWGSSSPRISRSAWRPFISPTGAPTGPAQSVVRGISAGVAGTF